MGAILCTLITLPIQIVLQFLIPVIQQIVTTICNWVGTVITTIITIVRQICNWLPWPLNRLCNWVVQVITLVETIWNWVCNTVIQTIITIITIIVTLVYYIFQIVCVLVNIGIGSPGWLLCISGVTPQRSISVCVKVLTDINGNSQVTNLAINENLDMLTELYGQCNIRVRISGVERIVNPNLLTTTNCSFWGLFSSWHVWFVQNSCLCCNSITVYFVDDIIGASGCAYWGENYCRVDQGANFDPTVVAHEIGHLLNLGHSNDPNNLMIGNFSTTSFNITNRQCCTMRLSPYVQ